MKKRTLPPLAVATKVLMETSSMQIKKLNFLISLLFQIFPDEKMTIQALLVPGKNPLILTR